MILVLYMVWIKIGKMQFKYYQLFGELKILEKPLEEGAISLNKFKPESRNQIITRYESR